MRKHEIYLTLKLSASTSKPTFEKGKAYFKKQELYKDWHIIDYEEYDDYDEKEKQTNKVAYVFAVKP